jgi:phosphatidylinositol glycan class O
MVVFLLVSLALFHVLRALIAPQASLRLRILGFGLLLAFLARTLGLSTVCREEQQPYCTVTFYEANGAPQWSIYAIVPFMFMLLPRVIALVLGWSKSYSGPAPVFVAVIWRAVILLGALYWCLEWMETWDGLVPERIPLVKSIKLWLARFAMSAVFGLMPYLWASSGLCLDIEREKDQTGAREDEVTVLGFGNAFGSTYLLFVLIAFCLVQLVSTPLAQIVLGGVVVAVVAHLELTDSQRDAVLLHSGFAQAGGDAGGPGAFDGLPRDAMVRPSFTDAVPLALLSLLAFFVTGHQAVLATIQWKAAFVGFETVTYPWSPLLVILNTWGPTALVALCVPLLAVWNVSPRPNGSVPVLGHTLQMALAFSTYFAAITLASAVTAAWLRRHLMVWKVFAPRFMLAGVTLVVVDVALLVAVGFGLRVTSWKVWRTFKSLSV